MAECIFCAIVAGTSPAFKIHEDDRFLAFLDIYPYGEGHTLVIPKEHFTHVWDLPEPGALFTFATTIANHYRQIYDTAHCFSLVIEEGVPHAHLHLLPATQDTKKRYFPLLSKLRQPQLDPAKAKKLQEKLQFA